MAKKNTFDKIINIKNKKASYEFEFIDTFKAGLVLRGSEIKSIREGKVSLTEAYCYFKGEELFIKQMHIAPYTLATHYNHDPVRERKLLLQKQELRKLQNKFSEKGLSIVPVRIYINDRGLAKMEIALAKGKKIHDKRQSIKEKDAKRDLQRMAF
ncbi:SsrA-binding protein [Cyclobacterium xiamenense]|uniref:SsrA-binding protein n=1 Tax=Cyclobacterium xiamenense TaxID=1297121 RepID=A0A1H6WKQ9_9BACT|nr:SsrA-binding protein SmpB [Cyclobacterium xiamenense]SEJ17528.1 SsrA-binding protein [Cyclobacterium xiamenense]